MTPYSAYTYRLCYIYDIYLNNEGQWILMNMLEVLDKLDLYANIPE